MIKLTILKLSAAATAAAFALPLSAQIIVSPADTAPYVAKVSADLDHQLDQIRTTARWEPSGIAQVRFRAGADGKPFAITTYRRSGDARLDRAVARAVARMTSLGVLPDAKHSGKVIQANVIVARSQSEFDRYSARLARDEAARIASAKNEKAVLAFTIAAPFAS